MASEDDDFSLSDASDGDDAFSASEAEEQEDEEDDEPLGEDSDFSDAPPPPKRAKKDKPAAKKKEAKAPKQKKAAASPAKGKAPAKKEKQPAVVKKAAAAAAPAGKSAPAVAPIKAGEAEGAVLNYMRKTNRPYSMLNVFENMHRAIAKPSLTKVLDKLVDKEELVAKTYGKAKIYYYNQNKLPVPSEEERAQVESQIKAVESECVSIEQELKTSEAALAGVNAQISDADLEIKLRELTEETETLGKKLAELERPDRVPVSPGRKDKLKRRFTTLRTAWVARKRIVTDAVDQIADGMEKKPKVVMDLCGIETDADAGVKEIPSI